MLGKQNMVLDLLRVYLLNFCIKFNVVLLSPTTFIWALKVTLLWATGVRQTNGGTEGRPAGDRAVWFMCACLRPVLIRVTRVMWLSHDHKTPEKCLELQEKNQRWKHCSAPSWLFAHLKQSFHSSVSFFLLKYRSDQNAYCLVKMEIHFVSLVFAIYFRFHFEVQLVFKQHLLPNHGSKFKVDSQNCSSWSTLLKLHKSYPSTEQGAARALDKKRI